MTGMCSQTRATQDETSESSNASCISYLQQDDLARHSATEHAHKTAGFRCPAQHYDPSSSHDFSKFEYLQNHLRLWHDYDLIIRAVNFNPDSPD
jgi:hypothetical protein